jgi:3-oxoacyl-(acyl-carrier-protein) synthase/acyl carrier protein
LDAPAQSGLAVKAKRNADIDSTRRESPTDAVRSHAFSEVESLLRGLIAEQCDLSSDEVDPTQSFYEMGLKSVVLLNVVTALERRLGRTLSPILLFEYTTIHELAAYLCSDAGPQKVDAENAVEHSVATTKVTSDTGEIAIIGFAGRFPGARTPEELWQVLRSGQDCVRFVPRERWDHSRYYDASKEEFGKTYCRWGGFIDGVDEFDPLFFNIPPLEAELMDPQARLFLQTAWELTESVGLTRKTLKSQYAGKVGVYVGAMYQHYNTVALQAPAGAMTAISSFNAIANHASYFLGLHGPSIAMDTGCSSALTAIHFACRDLNGGDCLLAIAGAVNLTVHPNKYLALSRLQLLSSDPGVRSFGQSDGYLPAECVGALLLKPLNRAKADGDRVLAVIKATAINHGGHSSGYTTPNLQAQADLFESVLSKAKVDPRTISYVEAAANGSLLGDAIEVNALDRTFVKHSVAPRSCAIGTIKSNLGHAEAASGISQIAKLLLQMRHGMIVPSIKTEPGNVSLNWEETSFALQSTLSKWERPVVDLGEGAREYPRRAMVNSFGAGGAYASAVIEEYLPQIAGNDAPSASGTHVCVFSARRPPQLTLVVKQMLQFLEAHPEVPLNDVAYTLQVGREEMEYRYAVAVQNHVQLAEALRRFLADESEETGAVSIASGARRAKCVRAVRSNKENAADACNSLEELSPQYVAKQWVQGYEFDWARHHCASAGTIIGLPTYPFSRDRYWIIPALASSVSAVTAEVSLPVAEQHMLDASMTMVEQSVCNFLMQFLGVRGIDLDLDHGLQSYGVDSLIGLRLARYLEKTFGVRLTRRSMYEHQTLRALSRYVTEKLARNEAPCVRDQGVEAVGQPIALDAQVEHTTAVLRDHDAGFAATQHKFRTTIRMESDNSDGRGIDNESR